MKGIVVHDTQNLAGQYQKIGVLMFGIGIALSVLGEIELITILFNLPLTVVPKLISTGTTFYSSIFYLILGNLVMLVEYQFFRKKPVAKT